MICVRGTRRCWGGGWQYDAGLASHDYVCLSTGAAELSHASVLEALHQGNFSIQGLLSNIDPKQELEAGRVALVSVNRYMFDVGKSLRMALQEYLYR